MLCLSDFVTYRKRFYNQSGRFGSHVSLGVTLAQLVKAGQADVQRFEPHLRHNWFSSVSCKVQTLWAPSGTNHKAKLTISLSGWLSHYTKWSIYKVYLKRRGSEETVPIYAGYNTTLLCISASKHLHLTPIRKIYLYCHL